MIPTCFKLVFVPTNSQFKPENKVNNAFHLRHMVAYFCHHLSDNYVDLSDNHVDLSDNHVDLSDLYVDLSLIHL